MPLNITSSTHSTVADLLAEPRFELMPFESFSEQLSYLPDGAAVTVTASPTKELEATIDCTEEAATRGYEAIPHIAARYVSDEAHLEEIAQRLKDVGVRNIFVPGGDREEPLGEFGSAYELLDALENLGYEFEEVGITGYPEGHEFLSDETLVEAMKRKRPYATYITTQLCYEPDDIVDWVEQIRERGADLPVYVGIPGVVKYQRLLRISSRTGVGDSIQFLQKTSGIIEFVRRLVGSRGTYTPDHLIEGLAPCYDNPQYDIQGLHIYTFNEAPDTEGWRQGLLAQSGAK